MINQSEQLAESIDQGEPPATQFFLLEDTEPSEPSAEAFFPSTESIDQGEPPATQFFLLEDSALSELFATEAHFALLEDIESSESNAEAFSMKETETFDLLDDFFNNISSWEVFQILCNL